MSQPSKSPYRQEKAQTFVEFALVFPILLMLVYGIIEFGRMLLIYTAVTSSSREGARYGSASGDVGGYVPHYADCTGIVDAITRVGILAGINPTYPGGAIDIQYDSGPGSTIKFSQCPPSINEIHSGDRILVYVQADYEPIIPFLNFQGFVIDSEARRTILKDMEIEGTPPPPIPTFTYTPTNTPIPTYTYTPTDTATPSNTPLISPTPTDTPSPSPTPTDTATPTPTLSPTPTPFCEIDSVDMFFDNKSFSWIVQSMGPDTVQLIELTVGWPTYNGAILGQIDFGSPIWSGSVSTSPFTVCSSCWTGLPNVRYLVQYESRAFTFHLSKVLDPGDYWANAIFINEGVGTCVASISENLPATSTPSPTSPTP